MNSLWLVLLFSSICFLGAFAIQTRKRWAWTAGWVVLASMELAVIFLAADLLGRADSPSNLYAAALVLFGGSFVWTFWFRWWRANRDFFNR